jgi:transcriptional regulator with XRE-family HTH domain
MANNIRRLREARGWSQEELGIKMAPYLKDGKPLSKSAVGKLEDGKIQLTEKYLLVLTKLFDCNPLDVLRIEGWDAVFIKGHIKMGEARHSLFWDESDWKIEQLPKPKRFPDAHRFVIEDHDTGTVYECVDDAQYLSAVIVDKLYIIEFKKSDGTLAFLKARVKENSTGQLTLRPQNANGEIPTAIPVHDQRVKIVARIVRSIQEE